MALVTGITLPNNGDRIKAENYNDPITKLLAQVNGNLDESNIASISGTKVTTGTLPYNALNTAAQNTIGGGWNSLGATPSSVTYNGGGVYDLVFSAIDLTPTVTSGMYLRTTRSVAAPVQSTNLNGTTQYYSKTSPAGMTFTDDFTASAWVKLSSYGSGSVVASRYNGTSGWVFYVESTGQVIAMGINGGSGNTSRVTSNAPIPLNKWVHITAQLDMSAFTATPTTSYVMIDGVDVASTVSRAGTNPTALVQAGNLEIGSWNGGLNTFPGKIAQVAIFNSKVTQATMRGYISQTLAGNEASLISAYSFNNAITDLNTTNANNLTANNGAVATNADSPFGGQAGGSISSTLDYARVQSVVFSTNTTITVRVPDGNTIPTSGGVSAASYSASGSPYGLPSPKSNYAGYYVGTDANGWTITVNSWGKRVYSKKGTVAISLGNGISFSNQTISSTPVDVGTNLANYNCNFTTLLPSGGRQISTNFMFSGTIIELGAINTFTGGGYTGTATVTLIIIEQ